MRQGSEVWGGGQGSAIYDTGHISIFMQKPVLLVKGREIWQNNRVCREAFWTNLRLCCDWETPSLLGLHFVDCRRRALRKRKGGRMGRVKGRWRRGRVEGAEGLLTSKSPRERVVLESRLDLYEVLTSHDPRGKVRCAILKIKQASLSLFTSAPLVRHQT